MTNTKCCAPKSESQLKLTLRVISALVLLALSAGNAWANHTHLGGNTFEFCKNVHSHRVIQLWDGYPEWWGGRDGVEVALVTSVQQALRAYDERTNYLSRNVTVDGYFGYGTRDAVNELQRIEIQSGGVDGRVGRGTRSVLCNLDNYLNSCRSISYYWSFSRVHRMNGCGRIAMGAYNGELRNIHNRNELCEMTLTWLSGSGGQKTVRQTSLGSRTLSIATGVRNGALFQLRGNCYADGPGDQRVYDYLIE